MLTDWGAQDAVAKIDELCVWGESGGGSGGGLAYLFIHLPVARRPTPLCQ